MNFKQDYRICTTVTAAFTITISYNDVLLFRTHTGTCIRYLKKLTKHLEIQTITTEHMLHIPHILQQTDKNKMAVREDFCEELCKYDDS